MDEYVKKESKTYIIQADSAKEDVPEAIEQVISETETNNEEISVIPEPSKKIEVINGMGEDLDISDVSEYLEIQKPKENKKENIVIPEEKK